MALRNQPYIPLYIQDYLTDEKLNECSLSTQGVYIKIMCILHKSDEYGVILLKQKDKQSKNQALNFASKISKQLPIELGEIEEAVMELIDENVLLVNGDKLIQRRMVKDNAISEARSKAGQKGGENTQKFAKAKTKANSEDVNEDVNEDIDRINYKEISKQFTNICQDLPIIRSLGENRKKHIRARINEYNLNDIFFVFKKVHESDFLCGRGDNDFKADFDWIFNQANFTKILEGKYINKNKKHEIPTINN